MKRLAGQAPAAARKAVSTASMAVYMALRAVYPALRAAFLALMAVAGGAALVPALKAAEMVTLGPAGAGAQLALAAERRCAPYDRRDYRYPRQVEDAIIKEYGEIYSPYTGERFASKWETDIEHIVAISEAHDSGLCAAPPAVKRQFARDPLNLTLASPALNRTVKQAKDAAEWLPARNRCWFAARVVAVKAKYALTIDRREAAALSRVLSACDAADLRLTAR